MWIEDRVARGCRKLYSEELQNLYSSPDIIRLMKSRRKRWARNGEKGKANRILM
jgi:hypothetical protein